MNINKDQVQGRVKETAGRIQEATGKAMGSTSQQVKGTIKKNVGSAQAKFGDMKSHVKDALQRHEHRAGGDQHAAEPDFPSEPFAEEGRRK